MRRDLVPVGQLYVAPAEVEPTGELVAQGRSPRTLEALEGDQARLEQWARARGVVVDLDVAPVPPGLLQAFLEDAAAGRLPDGRPRAVATVVRYAGSVAILHAQHTAAGTYPAGTPSPTLHPGVRGTLLGLRRSHRGERPRQATPLLLPTLREACRLLPDTPHGVRDRAVLLLGWASSCRGAELVALDVPDVLVAPGVGVALHLRASKTDRLGVGRTVQLPWGSSPLTCPGRAALAWLEVLQTLQDGPGAFFREVRGHRAVQPGRMDRRTVQRVVRGAVALTGEDPRRYGAHSLRAGLVTSMLDAGRTHAQVMRATGHTDPKTVSRYDRPRVTGEAPAAGLGL